MRDERGFFKRSLSNLCWMGMWSIYIIMLAAIVQVVKKT